MPSDHLIRLQLGGRPGVRRRMAGGAEHSGKAEAEDPAVVGGPEEEPGGQQSHGS